MLLVCLSYGIGTRLADDRIHSSSTTEKGFHQREIVHIHCLSTETAWFFLKIQRKPVDNSIGIRHVAKNKPFTGFLPVDNENED